MRMTREGYMLPTVCSPCLTRPLDFPRIAVVGLRGVAVVVLGGVDEPAPGPELASERKDGEDDMGGVVGRRTEGETSCWAESTKW